TREQLAPGQYPPQIAEKQRSVDEVQGDVRQMKAPSFTAGHDPIHCETEVLPNAELPNSAKDHVSQRTELVQGLVEVDLDDVVVNEMAVKREEVERPRGGEHDDRPTPSQEVAPHLLLSIELLFDFAKGDERAFELALIQGRRHLSADPRL